MKPIIAFSTISKQFCSHGSNFLLKLEYDINASAAATVYVQIHDFPAPADLAAGRTAPASGSVPIKSWPAPAGSVDWYKEFKRGELTISNGLFVCVSTTQSTLTIGTGNNKFDSVAAELDRAEEPSGTTVVTGLANDTITVWNDGDGVHKLVRFAATSQQASVGYIMLFADIIGLEDGAIPLAEWKMPVGATIYESFGRYGRDVYEVESAVVRNGCVLTVSATPNAYSSLSAGGANIYAEYL